jgi:hypothetical protein
MFDLSSIKGNAEARVVLVTTLALFVRAKTRHGDACSARAAMLVPAPPASH